MSTPEELKEIVRKKYAEIVVNSGKESSSCCGPTSCCDSVFSVMADDYGAVDGYVPDADLNLGCGIPTSAADIRPGMVVLDLGSGAGNDVFIAAKEVGETGFVYGVDMTDSMIKKANENKAKLGFRNVEFRLGEIENLPIDTGSVDVVISNCVLNLVPDKAKAFAEIHRVLKPGGRFAISDIVLEGTLTPELQSIAELYTGCVAGALQKSDYLAKITGSGFPSYSIAKEKEIVIPEGTLKLLSLAYAEKEPDLQSVRILSVTVKATKP
jgi:arsenite methyltransferase